MGQVSYENGSHATRHAYMPLPNRFTDANGQCAHHEVCIILTNHQTAIPVLWRVELHHLKPVLRKKKGDWIVIISGDMLVACIDMGACNFSNLALINITEIMFI